VILLWEIPLASLLLVIDEHSRLKCLRGSGRQNVIIYVHGRIVLYCSSMYETEHFSFFDPSEVASTRTFITQGQVVYNEPPRSDRWPRGR
jgi:hypothetical protein